MAESDSDNVKSMMKDMITCSICLCKFNSPKSLPCLHTFCLKCLQTLPTSCHVPVPNFTTTVNELSCPQCRKCCQIPDSGVDNFPANFMVQNMIDTMQSSRYCAQHKDEFRKTTHFCLQCAERVCADCVSTVHPTHECKLITEASALLDHHVDDTMANIDAHMTGLINVFDKQLDFEKEVSAAEAGIKHKGDELKQLVDKRVATLLEELNSVKSEAKAKMISDDEFSTKVDVFVGFMCDANRVKQLPDLRDKALAVHALSLRSQALLRDYSLPPVVWIPNVKFLQTAHSISANGELCGSTPFLGHLTLFCPPNRKKRKAGDDSVETLQVSRTVLKVEEILVDFTSEEVKNIACPTSVLPLYLQEFPTEIEPKDSEEKTKHVDLQLIGAVSSSATSPPQQVLPRKSASTCPDKTLAIGIDLGTSYSRMGVFKNGKLQVIEDKNGLCTMPSCIAFTNNGLLVGNVAKWERDVSPLSTVFGTKRALRTASSSVIHQTDRKHWPGLAFDKGGTRIQVRCGDKEETYLEEEVIGILLHELKKIAQTYLGQRVTVATISVPSLFSSVQRQAIRNAATIAGFHSTYIINEAVAAAMACGFQKQITDRQNALIFDFGGGTVNVAVVSFKKNGLCEVRSTSGDPHLGGEDFDNRLVMHFAEEFKCKHGKDLTSNKKAMSKLRGVCERAKCMLSVDREVPVNVDIDGINFKSTITRSHFNQLNTDIFDKVLIPVKKSLCDAKIDKSAIDHLILVGGSTRIPKVRKLLMDFFDGRELTRSDAVDEIVAFGAALLASIRQCGKPENLILLDVAPISLGIESADGVMTTLISRNTTIPAVHTTTFTTDDDNQRTMVFKIFEGEHDVTKDNAYLGYQALTGIPPAPRGVLQVDVTFDLDDQYNLTVRFKRKGHETERKIKPAGLSHAELEKAQWCILALEVDKMDNTGADSRRTSVIPYAQSNCQ